MVNDTASGIHINAGICCADVGSNRSGNLHPDNGMCTLEDLKLARRVAQCSTSVACGRIVSRENSQRSTVRAISAQRWYVQVTSEQQFALMPTSK